MNGLLQPEDSKRVADALIEMIGNADFDIAYEVARKAEKPLNDMAAIFEEWLRNFAPVHANLEYVLEKYLEKYGLDVTVNTGE